MQEQGGEAEPHVKGFEWHTREFRLSLFIVGSQGRGLTYGRECSLFQPGQHGGLPWGTLVCLTSLLMGGANPGRAVALGKEPDRVVRAGFSLHLMLISSLGKRGSGPVCISLPTCLAQGLPEQVTEDKPRRAGRASRPGVCASLPSPVSTPHPGPPPSSPGCWTSTSRNSQQKARPSACKSLLPSLLLSEDPDHPI